MSIIRKQFNQSQKTHQKLATTKVILNELMECKQIYGFSLLFPIRLDFQRDLCNVRLLIEIESHPFKNHFVEEVVSKCLEHSIKLMFTGNARIRLKRIREAVEMKNEI